MEIAAISAEKHAPARPIARQPLALLIFLLSK